MILLCYFAVNECLSSPCSSPGTLACVQLVNDYRCDCKPGYGGHLCEKKVDLCHNSPCQNGGVCSVKSVGSGKNRKDVRICSCPAGFHGELCQFNGSPCENNPCRSGGTCLIKGGNFMCKCPSGTDGEYCQIDGRTDCSLQPCLHGGKCQLQPGGYGYVCKCSANRGGKNCERYDHDVSEKSSKSINGFISGEIIIFYDRRGINMTVTSWTWNWQGRNVSK